jgi:hypothetical protein
VPSQVEIQCECAFTNMNAVSGEDLTGVFSRRSRCRRGPRYRRHTPHCHRRSAVLPDDGDMHLGRERPLFSHEEPRQEGGRGGRSRPTYNRQ